MRNRIIVLVTAIAIAIALGTNLRRSSGPTLTDTSTTTQAVILDEAWGVFDAYRAAAKAHDLDKLSSLAYQLSDTCKNPEQRDQCDALMDNVVFFSQDFVKGNFSHVAADAKQVILYGDFGEVTATSSVTYSRRIAYFARSEDGALKFLSFSPFDGVFIVIQDGDKPESVSKRLREMTADTDGDTLADEQETCTGQTVTADCVKYNPKRIDTDGDGWWDSIENRFYR